MAKRRGNAFLDQFDNQFRRPFRLLGLKQKEIGRLLVGHHRHFAVVDAMGIGDDKAIGGLAEDGLQPHNFSLTASRGGAAAALLRRRR